MFYNHIDPHNSVVDLVAQKNEPQFFIIKGDVKMAAEVNKCKMCEAVRIVRNGNCRRCERIQRGAN